MCNRNFVRFKNLVLKNKSFQELNDNCNRIVTIRSNVYHTLQGFEGGPPILLKEEPEDGPRSMQKVPSLSDLSDPENSLGECFIYFIFNINERFKSKFCF